MVEYLSGYRDHLRIQSFYCTDVCMNNIFGIGKVGHIFTTSYNKLNEKPCHFKRIKQP